jgi:Rps23 Pro-64 3,4-dihydroxylase Tpa1-like proline 4-hydroxylase
MSTLKKFSEDEVVKFRTLFDKNAPLRYLYIDNYLDRERVRQLANDFPTPEWESWRTLGDSYQKNKFACNELSLLPQRLRELVIELNSPAFLQFLENVTGIKKLISDPYLTGGGLHLSTEGGILAPHTDFHIYDRLDLYRRINVLIYLNPEWKEGDGGSLRLWDGKNPEETEVQFDPVGGRMFVFATNDRSIHGFTDPVRAGTERKSIALYYYTSYEDSQFAGDSTTHWYGHDKIRLRQYPREILFRSLHQTSRGFSLLAHLANPRQGRNWWKTRQSNQRRTDV